MSVSGIGQSYYQNSVATTKNVNNTEKFALEKTDGTKELPEAEKMEAFKKEMWKEINSLSWGSSISIQITDKAFEKMMNDI